MSPTAYAAPSEALVAVLDSAQRALKLFCVQAV